MTCHLCSFFPLIVLVAKTFRKNYNKALRRIAEGRAPPPWIWTRRKAQAVPYRTTITVRAASYYLQIAGLRSLDVRQKCIRQVICSATAWIGIRSCSTPTIPHHAIICNFSYPRRPSFTNISVNWEEEYLSTFEDKSSLHTFTYKNSHVRHHAPLPRRHVNKTNGGPEH
jgi:hypothetical protein